MERRSAVGAGDEVDARVGPFLAGPAGQVDPGQQVGDLDRGGLGDQLAKLHRVGEPSSFRRLHRAVRSLRRACPKRLGCGLHGHQGAQPRRADRHRRRHPAGDLAAVRVVLAGERLRPSQQLSRAEHLLQRVAFALDHAVRVAACGGGSRDPRLDHRPRSRSGLATGRADGGGGSGRAGADGVPRPDRQARVATWGGERRFRLVGSAPGRAADPRGLDVALAGERPQAQAPRRVMSTDQAGNRPDRNLARELVRVTEAAALAAARMVGRGDKAGADQAAVDAMRNVLDSVAMDGVVVIGEGEKDEAPMLYNGEQIGDGSPPQVDIAVDPLEGTRLTALGMPSALAVIALAERGSMFDPGPCVYMEKIAGGPEIADLLDLDRPLPETLALIAERKHRDIRDVMVVMLDRERHHEAMRVVREAGARVRLILDGDVSASLLAVSENSSVDLLWGIGGTPEGVISAAAIKCSGGQLLGRLWPRDEGERTAAEAAGYDLTKVLNCDDLVSGDDVFFSATGVTDGDVLQGVRYQGDRGATTESLVMRSRSGTVRRINANHDRAKLRALTGVRYG